MDRLGRSADLPFLRLPDIDQRRAGGKQANGLPRSDLLDWLRLVHGDSLQGGGPDLIPSPGGPAVFYKSYRINDNMSSWDMFAVAPDS